MNASNEETLKGKEDKASEPKEEAFGFDATDTSLDSEIKAGEWQRLYEFPSYQKRSRQGKIIATYKAISNRLNQLIDLYYELVRNSPDKAVRLLKEIKRLRYLQSFLLDCLIWEERGELKDHPIPPELADLL